MEKIIDVENMENEREWEKIIYLLVKGIMWVMKEMGIIWWMEKKKSKKKKWMRKEKEDLKND